MNLTFIVSPIVGSIIGYCTNWVAIKMLFRPLEEKRIMGIKVPFTPGVIPRRRGKLAESIGDTVGRQLLTPDAFHRMLQGEEMKGKVRKFIRERIESLEQEERSINELLTEVIDDPDERDNLKLEFKKLISQSIGGLLDNEKIVDLIKKELEDIDPSRVEEYFNSDQYKELRTNLEEFLIDNLHKEETKGRLSDFLKKKLMSVKESEQTIGDLLPEGVKKSLKEWLNGQGPEFAEQLVEFLSSESTKERINNKLEGYLNNNPLMQMIGGFIDKEKIINQFVDYVVKFLNEPENQVEIVAQVEKFINSTLDTKVANLIERVDEGSINELSNFVLNKFGSREMIDNLLTGLEKSILKKVKSSQELNSEEKINISEVISDLAGELLQSKFIFDLLESWAYAQLDSLGNRPVTSYFNNLDGSTVRKLEAGILASLQYIVEHHLGRVLATLDFKEMVIKKVNNFDILEVEALLLNVIETELKAITWFGAVLGLIMGLITPLISMVMG